MTVNSYFETAAAPQHLPLFIIEGVSKNWTPIRVGLNRQQIVEIKAGLDVLAGATAGESGLYNALTTFT